MTRKMTKGEALSFLGMSFDDSSCRVAIVDCLIAAKMDGYTPSKVNDALDAYCDTEIGRIDRESIDILPITAADPEIGTFIIISVGEEK